MNRRELLHALSIGTLTTGCLGVPSDQSPTTTTTDRESTDTPTSTAPSPDATPTETETQTPTEQEPTESDPQTTTEQQICTGTGETRLQIGESYRFSDWIITTESVELTQTFQLDDTEKVYEVPYDREFAIARVTVENVGDNPDDWEPTLLRFIRDPCTVEEPVRQFDHPEIGAVSITELERVTVEVMYDAQGYIVEPGTKANVWHIANVPTDTDRSQLELGFGWTQQQAYPVRWVPQP